MLDETDGYWPGVGSDMPFEVEALLEMTEEEARARLALAQSDFRSLCARGRLVPVRAENGRGIFARDEVLRVQRLLDRARRLERARRVHDEKMVERGRMWSAHLRHEAALLRKPTGDPTKPASADGETLARALESAARLIERTLHDGT